ncbi:MAG TPA: NAD(P)/FAD-dependent oxidoreductase [Xanthobacteraceae bacterium]|nr:NAD(P)/FAD-dependent oxidoreductase [Xanthobacteraceae bacterium]
MEKTTVAIIGAGPAGLAAGACLRAAGVDFVMLEKEHAVGASWRRHYARLHLHTVKKYSSLPLRPFPKAYPRYVPRELMIRYLDDYAAAFDLRPRFGAAVRAVRRDGAAWVVDTGAASLRARFTVVATGYNAEPVVPAIPGIETFAGKVLHSADYVDAEPFAGRSVLVIGMGNTGAEIALDLAEGGARPTLSVRNGVHVVPRDLFGIPIQLVALTATRLLPTGFNDAIFPPILDFVLGNPARHGITRPKEGILQLTARAAKIPVLDVGTLRKISEGAIRMAPGLTAISQDGATFQNGARGDYDAIILATGYRPNYRNFLAADDIGPSDGRANEVDGIYFIGFRNVITGLLRQISQEAAAAAADIRGRVQ